MRSNERAINQLLDRIIEADNPTIIKAYENRLRLFEQNKALCAEKAANLGRPKGDFEKTVRSALTFLASPWEIYQKWNAGGSAHGLKTDFCRASVL